jgi:membrane protease subunit HflK
MSWNNQNGGPWGRPPGGPTPWGQGPGGKSPPDLEELLRRGQDRLRRVMPGGSSSGRGFLLLGVAVVAIWMASGFYTVQPNEVGLNLVFGKYTTKTSPGLNYNWPYPIGQVLKPKVTDRNAIDIGFVSREGLRLTQIDTVEDVPQESLMLTGDQNIADVKFRVIWQIAPARPEDFVFNIRGPRETVKAVSESAMRELVGRTPIQRLLTADRSQIEPAAQTLIQSVLDRYKAGVQVLQVQLLPVDPPQQVISAFKDVTVAQQDKDRLQNEAETYANGVVPTARGAASRILQEAEAYKDQTVAQARGQAARFDQIYDQYRRAPELTRRRLYLETMERVLGGADKVIIDQTGGNGVVPYLPLGGLDKPAAPAQGGRK